MLLVNLQTNLEKYFYYRNYQFGKYCLLCQQGNIRVGSKILDLWENAEGRNIRYFF